MAPRRGRRPTSNSRSVHAERRESRSRRIPVHAEQREAESRRPRTSVHAEQREAESRRPLTQPIATDGLPPAGGDHRVRALAFRQRVERVVNAIPRGQVLSYAQVALRAGRPGGARAVVRALHSISRAPWWRVIRSDGTLAAEVAFRQKAKLQRDGVLVRGRRVVKPARR